MNGTATRFLRLGVSLAGLVTLGWVLTGQAARPAIHGTSVPTDWSHHHLIFSKPRSAEQLARVSEDPRYWQQVYRRQQRLALPAGTVETEPGLRSDLIRGDVRGDIRRPVPPVKLPIKYKKSTGFWSEDLGSGGTVGAANYPAKFAFATDNAFCDGATAPNQPDYVVYSTGLNGSVGQASVVAYDNLYFYCSGVTPLVYWAYNTGGQVLTSPVLSLDGTQVAFVETVAGAGVLVTLKWKAADGTVGTPSTPTVVTAMSLCPAATACMTLTPLTNSSVIPIDDRISSIFYDYSGDVGWVGTAGGWLVKITGVFKGTPTEVIGGGFPVQVNSGSALSSPVYDHFSNSVFVGDLAGILYRVSSTGGVTASGQLDIVNGIVDGPLVDSGNQFVYVFSSDDNSGACLDSLNNTVDCSGVFQFTTAFAAGTSGTEVFVGSSNASLTPNPMHLGGFDSAYYDSTGVNAATGNLYVCGNTGGIPTLYQVPLLAGALPVSGLGQAIAPLATTAAPCSPVTDIPNPNVLGAGNFSERIFASVQSSGTLGVCASSGCILNLIDTPWQPFVTRTIGQQLMSPRGHVVTATNNGTSAGTDGAPWPAQGAGTYVDGTEIWIDQGSLISPFVAYQSSHAFGLHIKILDTNGNIEISTKAGTTGVAPPIWNTVPGLTTTDGGAIWTNVGVFPMAALKVTGGTSGIIVDNVLGPSAVGASQVYFSTLSDQVCTTSGGTGGCAEQASQPALQ